MIVKTKTYVDLDGDRSIDKPSSRQEVADEKDAVAACVAYGARRFSMYQVDEVTMPSGEILRGQAKNSCLCFVVSKPPLQRDDAIADYTQRLAAVQSSADAHQKEFEIKRLQDSIDYLKSAASTDYYLCESINVGRPERSGSKYFACDGSLLFTIQEPKAGTSGPATPTPSP